MEELLPEFGVRDERERLLVPELVHLGVGGS
jgi:hypothetical protein